MHHKYLKEIAYFSTSKNKLTMNKFSTTILSIFIFSISISQNITLSSDSNSLTEGSASSVNITGTIDAVSDSDISIPLTLTGSASNGDDYTYSFATLNQATTIFNYQNYGAHRNHDDGRIITLHEGNINVYDGGTLTNYELQRSYHNSFELVGDIMYVKYGSQSIYSINLSDLENIVETEILTMDDSGAGADIYNFTVEGNNLLYVWNDSAANTNFNLSKLQIGGATELITQYNWYGTHPILMNDVAYVMTSGGIWPAESFTINYSDDDAVFILGSEIDPNEKPVVRDNKVYIYADEPNDGSDWWQIAEVDLNSSSHSWLAPNLSEIESFHFDNVGNLTTYSGVSNNLSLTSYQFAPQIKIPAGSTNGSITFSLINDNSNEAEETIIITPGTPTNGTLTDSSAITITITDNDNPSAVTFALSSDSIDENSSSSVTLTATADPVSGVDITIPFTLSGTAGSDEYSVSGTEIVIPAGSSTASVTISTSGLDDNEVELTETIIFTFGEITNGTTGMTDVTLNLESEDDPTITSMVVSPASVDEGSASVLTATIDGASSKDVTVPLTVTGTATNETDYTTSFESQGAEDLQYYLPQYYNPESFSIMQDGRHVFLSDSQLLIIDTETNTTYNINLSQSYYGGYTKVEGNKIYARNENQLSEIIIDIDGNLVSETIILTKDNNPVSGALSMPQNHQLDYGFMVNGNDLYYITRQTITGNRFVWKQDMSDITDSGSDLLDSGSDLYFQHMFYYNDDLYSIRSWQIFKYTSGEFQEQYNTSHYTYDIVSANDKVFIKYEQNNIYKFGELNPELSENNVNEIQFSLGSDIYQSLSFYPDQLGNLFLYNQENEGAYGVFKYQLSPQIKIPAGETEGTITFTSVDDDNDELTETIILTPGTPTNATLSDSSSVTISIEDNDDAPEITLSLSAASLTENSSNTVTLTATPDVVSEQEITLTYSLANSTAGSDEYSVSAETLVIAAGASSGSITVSSSEDDDSVEPVETIVFDFTAPDNATFATDGSSITINLISEDDASISSISGSPETIVEGTSSTVTMTIESATSTDVVVPVTITGSATLDQDYTASFASIGESTTISDNHGNYGQMKSHDDGRLFFMTGNILRVYDPSNETWATITLERSYIYFSLVSNIMYAQTYQQLYALDISDLDNITDEVIIDLSQSPAGGNFHYPISFEGSNMLYNVIDNTNLARKVYKKSGNDDPVLLAAGNNCCYIPILLNDRNFMLESSWLYELVDGEFIEKEHFGGYIDRENIEIENGNLYAHYQDYNDDTDSYLIVKLNFDNIDDNSNSNGSYDVIPNVPFTLNQNIVSFAFSNNNLFINEWHNDSGNYGIFKYQLSPQLKIPAGETEGTITFTSVDDDNDELTETIILTPGTPTNATLSDSSSVTISIEDNDDAPEITLSLSAASLTENSSNTVTLTATPDVVSEQEITLTYSLANSTAGSDEYSVSAETLVIAAGASSGSITVSSSEDDDSVEPVETIVFDFTAPDNATFATDGSSITINLISEDDPVSSLAATLEEITEGETTEITITIEQPASREVIVPLELSGDAMFNIDYTTDFETEGRESTIMTPNSNQDFGDRFEVLDDGRYIFLNGWTIRVYNPDTFSIETYYLYGETETGGLNSRYYSYMAVSGNNVYLQGSQHLDKFDVSQLSLEVDNQIIVETHVALDPENPNDSFYGQFHIENGNLIYQINVLNNSYATYTKQGNEDSIEIYSGNNYFQTLFLFNGRTYYANGNDIYEIYNGEITNSISYSNTYFYQMKAYNGIAYFLIENYNNDTREVHRIDIENDIVGSSSGNLGSSTIVNYELGEAVNYVKTFTFDAAGNIILYNRTNPYNYWGVFSYQLSPQITIPTGSTQGTFTFSATDDQSFENTEDIIITPGQPTFATLSSTEPLSIDIIDNDDAPIISFELSDENIYENSEISVTLTANVDNQSGVEITIPFTMDGSSADYLTGSIEDSEFSIRKTGTDIETSEIVIPPNATSGNITIYTYGYDDDEVEISESIIFNFTEAQLGETGSLGQLDQETITLNLISEDLATINNSTVESTELTEGESTIMQIQINAPTSEDIYVPVTFSGTATYELDYTTSSEATGEELLIGELSFSGFSHYEILSDGRHIFLNNGNIMVVAPDASYMNTAQLTLSNGSVEHYQYMVVEDDMIYIGNDNRLATVDITDISANQVLVETFALLDNVGLNGYNFTVENGTIVYGAYVDGVGTRQVWSIQDIESEPTLLGTSLECCYKPVLINGNVYRLETYGYSQLINGEDGPYINYNGYTDRIDKGRKIVVKNGILYGFSDEGDRDVIKIDLEAGNGFTQKAFDVDISDEINSTRSFDFAPNGDIIMVNETTNDNEYVVQLNSYLISAQIKIPAGETTGSMEIATVNDDSFEDTELIDAVIQTPLNAILNETAQFQIEILDNDEAPSISFELSSETIVEGSETDVTLTATLDEITSFETTIPFTLDGTADYVEGDSEASEYSISANSIVVPANTESASISVSTQGFDDDSVEILETIIFNFGDIQIGSAATVVAEPNSITLNIESDDDPLITSFSVDPIEFAEHEFTTITAEISEPSSRDVTVAVGLAGTAELDLDYTAVQNALGEESRFADLPSNVRNIDFDSDGRMIVLKNYYEIDVYELDGTITNIPLQYNATEFIVRGNDLILRDWGQITKLNLLTQETTLLTTQLTNSDVQHRERSFDYVNGKLFYATYDYNQSFWSVYSKEDNEDAVLLYNNYNSSYENMIVDQNETVRFYNGTDIYEIDVENQSVAGIGYISGLSSVSSVKKYNDKIYALDYAWGAPPTVYMIKEPILEEGPESIYYFAEQVPYQMQGNPNTLTINDFAFSAGDIYLYIQDNGTSTYYINRYNLAPRIKIEAGEISGTLVLSGIEDDLNAPGEETDETIDISFGSIENASLEESIVGTRCYF